MGGVTRMMEGKESNYTRTTSDYIITAQGQFARQHVDEYVQHAYQWYMDYVSAQKDLASYMYVMRSTTKGNAMGEDAWDDVNGYSHLTSSTKLKKDGAQGALSQDLLNFKNQNKGSSFGVAGDDDLNLAGLLNVLDGIVDCPGRIVVMTTNHPEKLVPALIRPGRVSLTVYLGFIQPTEAIAMLAHFFQCEQLPYMQDSVTRSLKTVIRTFTSAEMEQLCCEYDTIDEVLGALATVASKPKETLSAHHYTPAKVRTPVSESSLEDADSIQSISSDSSDSGSEWDSELMTTM
ncbi:hypothetical protein SARC_02335 [Sphaeroforma arctica JP610]|uniref:ATPase AAA-type core domain-containing protein n=1 Tax=Sphaeroforma arctica JP610 TaxID=667725 RepID=A0A0L0GB59_9EUKA|nr:hypothetical protein SARC_02335 [Sphaeroforma arctica JP610]KNC85498.1 hypothetical protein SARC_02335 [Sphaeroforma arctica JP610]|eukprot:XP_014159400.1 hypothetical protein SARC_02335 [Sphaeroforma arctica JP610]